MRTPVTAEFPAAIDVPEDRDAILLSTSRLPPGSGTAPGLVAGAPNRVLLSVPGGAELFIFESGLGSDTAPGLVAGADDGLLVLATTLGSGTAPGLVPGAPGRTLIL